MQSIEALSSNEPLLGSTAPELTSGAVWVGSEPPKMSGLRGRVVLINFRVHSCPNCHRSLPLMRDSAPEQGFASLANQGGIPLADMERRLGDIQALRNAIGHHNEAQ